MHVGRSYCLNDRIAALKMTDDVKKMPAYWQGGCETEGVFILTFAKKDDAYRAEVMFHNKHMYAFILTG